MFKLRSLHLDASFNVNVNITMNRDNDNNNYKCRAAGPESDHAAATFHSRVASRGRSGQSSWPTPSLPFLSLIDGCRAAIGSPPSGKTLVQFRNSNVLLPFFCLLDPIRRLLCRPGHLSAEAAGLPTFDSMRCPLSNTHTLTHTNPSPIQGHAFLSRPAVPASFVCALPALVARLDPRGSSSRLTSVHGFVGCSNLDRRTSMWSGVEWHWQPEPQ